MEVEQRGGGILLHRSRGTGCVCVVLGLRRHAFRACHRCVGARAMLPSCRGQVAALSCERRRRKAEAARQWQHGLGGSGRMPQRIARRIEGDVACRSPSRRSRDRCPRAAIAAHLRPSPTTGRRLATTGRRRYRKTRRDALRHRALGKGLADGLLCAPEGNLSLAPALAQSRARRWPAIGRQRQLMLLLLGIGSGGGSGCGGGRWKGGGHRGNELLGDLGDRCLHQVFARLLPRGQHVNEPFLHGTLQMLHARHELQHAAPVRRSGLVLQVLDEVVVVDEFVRFGDTEPPRRPSVQSPPQRRFRAHGNRTFGRPPRRQALLL
mmetsp:Transcript_93212/g.301410  ORF Transcript_93212/g.301410 Transcript_93212/m.301410 type:complete len:322 (+) Transcript_93212:407-1372(+)